MMRPQIAISYGRALPTYHSKVWTVGGTALELALTPVTKNAGWTPYSETFDEVEMVLVPVGCFKMGNDPRASYFDETANNFIEGVPDGGEICFTEPFWIDRYEVTNA